MSSHLSDNTALSDVCELITDGTHFSPKSFDTGEFKYITSKNVREGRLDLSDVTYVGRDVHNSIFSGCPVRLGDVLYVKDGANTGLAAINTIEEPFSMLSSVALIRPKKNKLDARYLMRWLNSPYGRAQMLQNMSGAAIKRLVLAQIRRASIPIPPLDQQRRIAAILDQADDLRRKRRDALERAKLLPSVLFLQMFGDWSRPGFNGRLFQLGEKLEFLTSGSRGWAEYYRDTGSLFLRIQNVKHDELDLSDVAHVDPPRTAEAQRTRVRSGDVLLSITADLGRTAVVPDGIGEAFINQHLSILRSSKVEPRYLSAAISSRAGQIAVQAKNREGVKAGFEFRRRSLLANSRGRHRSAAGIHGSCLRGGQAERQPSVKSCQTRRTVRIAAASRFPGGSLSYAWRIGSSLAIFVGRSLGAVFASS